METNRTPEMEELLQKSRELTKFFRKEKTEEALENFKEAERQRYRQYYKENRESELKRVADYKKKQSAPRRNENRITLNAFILSLGKLEKNKNAKLQNIKELNS